MKENSQQDAQSPAAAQAAPADCSRALITALSHFIAHDLANPLSGLELTLYLLQRQELPAKALDMVERCLSQTRQLLRTVDALGALGGAEDPRLEQVDLQEVTAGLVSKLKLESRFNVVNELGADGISLLVKGNRPLLELALQQLLRNAAEASQPGDEIGIKSRQVADCLEIVVWDCGPGVKQEHLPQLFMTPFSTKERAGVGLLLANAAICGPNRGRLSYAAGRSGGARFSVLLPAQTSTRTTTSTSTGG